MTLLQICEGPLGTVIVYSSASEPSPGLLVLAELTH